MTELTAAQLAQQIASTLGEKNVHLVRRAVETLGAAAAQGYLVEAQRIEAAGGELVSSGRRRRTPGGVFFRMTRAGCTAEQRAALGWSSGAGADQAPASAVQRSPLTWEARLAQLPALLTLKGVITMSKITLTGRPGRLVETEGSILTVMESGRAPTLPKGLPTPPDQPTHYLVCIARKQWAKVAAALQDSDDALIVEGYPVYDARLPGLTVLAQNVTTRNLQRAKRAAEAA